LFQHSNSRLTPPDVEARVVEARRARLLALAAELVQDFGHSIGRNHAASGTTSPSCPNASSARTKNSSMSSAGIR
jgi:hypothetical protein